MLVQKHEEFLLIYFVRNIKIKESKIENILKNHQGNLSVRSTECEERAYDGMLNYDHVPDTVN